MASALLSCWPERTGLPMLSCSTLNAALRLRPTTGFLRGLGEPPTVYTEEACVMTLPSSAESSASVWLGLQSRAEVWRRGRWSVLRCFRFAVLQVALQFDPLTGR